MKIIELKTADVALTHDMINNNCPCQSNYNLSPVKRENFNLFISISKNLYLLLSLRFGPNGFAFFLYFFAIEVNVFYSNRQRLFKKGVIESFNTSNFIVLIPV